MSRLRFDPWGVRGIVRFGDGHTEELLHFREIANGEVIFLTPSGWYFYKTFVEKHDRGFLTSSYTFYRCNDMGVIENIADIAEVEINVR